MKKNTMRFLNSVILGVGFCILGVLLMVITSSLPGCSHNAKKVPTASSSLEIRERLSSVMINGRCLNYAPWCGKYYYFPCGCGFHSDCINGGANIDPGTGTDGTPCGVVYSSDEPLPVDTEVPIATPLATVTPTPTPIATGTCVPNPKTNHSYVEVPLIEGQTADVLNKLTGALPCGDIKFNEVSVRCEEARTDCCLNEMNVVDGSIDRSGAVEVSLMASNCPIPNAAMETSQYFWVGVERCKLQVLLGAFFTFNSVAALNAGYTKDVCGNKECYYGGIYTKIEPGVKITAQAEGCYYVRDEEECSVIGITPFAINTSIAIDGVWNKECDGKTNVSVSCGDIVGSFEIILAGRIPAGFDYTLVPAHTIIIN